MKAKTRKTILFAAVAFAAVWDILCLRGILPIEKWPFATGVLCLGSLITQIPVLFPSAAAKEEPPETTEAVRKKDRIFAGLLIGACLIWVVASIMCLFES